MKTIDLYELDFVNENHLDRSFDPGKLPNSELVQQGKQELAKEIGTEIKERIGENFRGKNL